MSEVRSQKSGDEMCIKKIFFSLCIIILSATVTGQVAGEPGLTFTLSPITVKARHYNFGFENVEVRKTSENGYWNMRRWDFVDFGNNFILQPAGWFQWGMSNYVLKLDSVEKRSGRYSTMIEQIMEVERSFGCVAYAIPAEYAGRRIEVRAWFKGEGSENTIGLLLRVDGGANESLAFDNMQQKNISAPKEWTEYSVSVNLPEEAETIFIGAILSGKGKMWVDDFRVLIDGKDIGSLQQTDLKYKALNDDEFDEGSYITFGALTPQMIENLALLAKVWGFAKYYHPTVGSGEYNWDYILFKAMASMLNAKNIDDRNTVLYALLYGLGDFRTVRRLNIPDSRNVRILPDLDWIDDRATFGEDLSKKMNEIRMARRDNKHHYIGLHNTTQTPKFRHENEYPHISPNDDGYRMLALFRFWNIVQYFYPNRDNLPTNWHNTLIEFIPKVAQADSSNYRQIFTDLVLRMGDRQTHIISSHNRSYGDNFPPLRLGYIENKPVVLESYMVEQTVELVPGDIIIKINQKPVEEIMEQIRKEEAKRYVVTNQIYHTIVNLMMRTDDDSIELQYQRDGQTFTTNLRCYPSATLQNATLPSGHELLTDEIGYFRSRYTSYASINRAMQEFSDTKGLIIDLRDFHAYYNWATVIARYLTSAPVYFAKKTKADIQIPGLFTFEPQRTGVRNRRYYTGKIVVLVNQNTIDYGELSAITLRAMPNTVIIGSATLAEARYGILLTSQFFLPCNIFGSLTSNGIYFPDGSGNIGMGIMPDIEVKPTIRGISEGRDEVLERAIEIINSR